MREIDFAVVHCSATTPDMDIGAKEIEAWHKAPPMNFSKIGYHFVIRRDGTIENGRSVDEVGAHARGHNDLSVGICLVGGVKKSGGKLVAENNFTPEQFDSLWYLLRDLDRQFKFLRVVGHRDLPGVKKDCPSFDVKYWYTFNR